MTLGKYLFTCEVCDRLLDWKLLNNDFTCVDCERKHMSDINTKPVPYEHSEPVGNESARWAERTDDAIDEIATLLDLHPIPYRNKEGGSRFLAAYRAELLKNAVHESR